MGWACDCERVWDLIDRRDEDDFDEDDAEEERGAGGRAGVQVLLVGEAVARREIEESLSRA
jgi:hypothetical protein